MIKDVFNSLMNDKVRTFFCWITFTITSMFIFLFFTVAMSDAVGVTMIRGKSDIPTILMVASVILCSVEIVFANDFFIKNKAKSLAVRLVCGATYTQITDSFNSISCITCGNYWRLMCVTFGECTS